jgi:rRNA maturation endonuclease Nob1
MSKTVVQKLVCDACESIFKVTYKDDEVSRNPIFCCFCGDELTFEDQDTEDPEDV